MNSIRRKMHQNEYMPVRIRFGRDDSDPGGQARTWALVLANLLTLVSISLAALGLWRLGADLDVAGGFVFAAGPLSHWQVWIGAALAVEFASWKLAGYGLRGTVADGGPENVATEAERAARG